MTATATGALGSAADTSAADAATAASQAATDQATADAATAAAAAAAGKTPEQVAADAATAETARVAAAAAEATRTAVPDKYEIKLPDNAGVSSAIVDKTAAIARELGLSNDNAQKTLTFVAQEAAAEVASQLAAWEQPTEANPEGGAKWREQEEGWRAASLADKDLGNGKPEQLQAAVTRATQVVAKFGDKDLSAFFEKSGLGSNPATLRFLDKIGRAMSEGSLVIGDRAATSDKSEQAVANRIYDHPTSKK